MAGRAPGTRAGRQPVFTPVTRGCCGNSEFRSLFECIRTEMAKGSPEGYNAETGLREPAQKPKPGEPNERQPLYRIRCAQEKHQLLRKVSRRKDCRGRQTASHPRGAAPVGRQAHRALARGDGSDVVQRLDLRYAETVCRRIADGASGVDESHCRIQEEKRQAGCAENRRHGPLQSAASLLCGAGGTAGVAADAALPQPGGGASGADEKQNEWAVDGSRGRVQQEATP